VISFRVAKKHSTKGTTNMSQNIIPEALAKLTAMARDMINGQHRNQAAISLKQHTETSMSG
jgi:hypothetical protein